MTTKLKFQRKWCRFACCLAAAGVMALTQNLPADTDKLVFAVDIIRHGDRSPTRELPGDEKLWPQGLGQLTEKGQKQERSLGAAMRHYYDEASLFAGGASADTILAFTSPMLRTRQSARCFLTGLLGDENSAAALTVAEQVTVHGKALGTRSVLIPNDEVDFTNIFRKTIMTDPVWRATNAALAGQFARWSELFLGQITNTHVLIPYADLAFIRGYHGFPQPAGVTEADTTAMLNAAFWEEVYDYHGELGRRVSRTLLAAIAEEMDAAAKARQTGATHKVKYILFSAHDSTLLAARGGLGAPLQGTNVPTYASLLHLGLVETAPGKFEVRASYHPGPEAGPPSLEPLKTWPLAQFEREHGQPSRAAR